MDKSKSFKQAPNCLLEDMDGEFLLYNPETATTLHLNQPSMIIWNLCDGETSLGELINELKQGFPDQADQIEQDVVDAVNGLLKEKVLVEAE